MKILRQTNPQPTDRTGAVIRPRAAEQGPRCAMTLRGGFTLLEMVITLSVLSVLAGLALTLFESVSTIEGSMQRDLAAMRDVRRLADALRSDAEVTRVREFAADRVTLQRVDDGTRIVYQIVDSKLLRESRRSRVVDEEKVEIQRDAFALPSDCSATFQYAAFQSATFQSDTFLSDSEAPAAPLMLDIVLRDRSQLPIRIEAVLAASNATESQ